MKETIYLVIDQYNVKRMTKNLPALSRGEIPVKLTITVEDNAFREPIIAKEIIVEDWRQGIDITDVEFKENIITEEEATIIREHRLEKMKEILEKQGYIIERPKQ